MPFPSLRRRTVNEATQLPDEHKSPSPSPSPRARSATVPGLTPRKSLSSLIDSVRKRGNPSPLPTRSHHDALEQELYSVYDASNPDHDPDRAGRSPSATDKDKRYYRTPSPHPLKMSAASSLSRLSKLNRGTPSGRSSDLSQAGSPPKTFLETLADAIRAPTSLFYKENKSSSKTEDSNTWISKPPSPAKSTSPKKSVRFKPGKSIIEDEPRSSPIDIPRATPSLPPVQLASTPLLQCFGNDHPHLIPTGRPPPPRVLDSTINFRQAMAAAQTSITEDELRDVFSVGTPASELTVPLPGVNISVENRLSEARDGREMEYQQGMLQEYDNQFSSKELEPCRSADIVIETDFVANNERVQDLPAGNYVETIMATTGPHFASDPCQYDGSPRESISSNDSSHDVVFPGLANTLVATSDVELEETATVKDSTESDCSDGPSLILARSTLMTAEGEDIWQGNPTHEDIRLRFKHPECYGPIDSRDSRDMDSASGLNADSQPTTRVKAAMTPSPDSTAESSPIQLPPSAASRDLTTELKRKRYQYPTSDGDPYLYVPESFLHNPPWVAELALRCDRPFPENRPRQLSPFYPGLRTERHERSTSMTGTMSESEPDGGAFLYPEHTEDQVEASSRNLDRFETSSDMWPAEQSAPITPSPSSVPLPLSIRPSARTYDRLHADESGPCPFANELGSLNLGDTRTEQNEFEKSPKAIEHSLENNYAGSGGILPQILRDTEEEKLARAAEVLKRFIHRKASGSNSLQDPTIDTEGHSAREHTTRIPRLKRLQGQSSEQEMEALTKPPLDRGRSATIESKWSAGSEISQDSGSGETLRTAISTDPTEGMDEDERMCKGIV
ncbi:hypothetical protein FOPE_07202 [Fonsecaea pedrosoi]|nr:hypothetical protein FOPE_07202 [Fonsecaea pedrosoi]